MLKVIFLRKIPGIAEQRLRDAGYDVSISPKPRVLNREELKNFVSGASAVVSSHADQIDGEIMDSAGSQLRIIANYAVGYDNVNLNDAKSRKIVVTNTPGVLSEAVAEHVFALMLAISRHILAADKYMRGGFYQDWDPERFLGVNLSGKILGIIGAGGVGSVTARIAHGFGMKVVYQDVQRNKEIEEKYGAQITDLPALLTNSDFVSLNVPLLSSTKHLISRGQLAMMKKTAVIINTSRGAVIDEIALVEALRNGTIAGACLDVYEKEPLVPSELVNMTNVVLTPHIAASTSESREEMSQIVANNVVAVLSGNGSINQVT